MKKILVLILGSAAVLLAAFGCTEPEKNPDPFVTSGQPSLSEPVQTAAATTEDTETEPPMIDYRQTYGDVLDRFSALLANGTGKQDPGEGETGLLEAITRGDSPDRMGYAITDLSGDGVPELLIGAISKKEASLAYGSEIYAVYTVVNGSPSFVLEGTVRSSYRYLGGHDFLYQSSDGAMNTGFGVYSLSSDGAALICQDYYFACAEDGSPEKTEFYRNTTGERDKAGSERLRISSEEFLEIEETLTKRLREIELSPFSVSSLKSEPPVRILRADEAPDGLSLCGEFVAGTEEPQSRVLFFADTGVTDFRVLSLTLENVDENGVATFLTQELYALDALTPEAPLAVVVTFYGSVPCYGISYVDGSGANRRFAVEMSGENGTLQLREF